MLAAGTPVDAHDALGRTALFFAAANGHVPLLRLLLAHGAVRPPAAVFCVRSLRLRRTRVWLTRTATRACTGPA
jgi:ankyrin repeat protein